MASCYKVSFQKSGIYSNCIIFAMNNLCRLKKMQSKSSFKKKEYFCWEFKDINYS